jgi:hypothetical protein
MRMRMRRHALPNAFGHEGTELETNSLINTRAKIPAGLYIQ